MGTHRMVLMETMVGPLNHHMENHLVHLMEQTQNQHMVNHQVVMGTTMPSHLMPNQHTNRHQNQHTNQQQNTQLKLLPNLLLRNIPLNLLQSRPQKHIPLRLLLKPLQSTLHQKHPSHTNQTSHMAEVAENHHYTNQLQAVHGKPTTVMLHMLVIAQVTKVCVILNTSKSAVSHFSMLSTMMSVSGKMLYN